MSTPSPPDDLPLVSAHRGGVGADRARENTRGALEDACRTGCEYVEFDVRRLGDGTFVLSHDAELAVEGRRIPLATLDVAAFRTLRPGGLTLDEALEILRGRVHAHLDLKLVSPAGLDGVAWEVLAARRAIAAMGVAATVVTSNHDASVAALRAWSRVACPDLLVGLSFGVTRPRSLLAPRRVRTCGANLVVAHHVLARLGLARWARRHGLPLLVWTVDGDAGLRRWLAPGRAWLVTTNRPAAALAIRRATIDAR